MKLGMLRKVLAVCHSTYTYTADPISANGRKRVQLTVRSISRLGKRSFIEVDHLRLVITFIYTDDTTSRVLPVYNVERICAGYWS